MTSRNMRAAAILIRSLDHPTARRVLQALAPSTAAQLTEMAATMGRVSSGEVRRAIADFHELTSQQQRDQKDVESPAFAPSPSVGDGVTDQIRTDQTRKDEFDCRVEETVNEPFPAELLVQTLERERPQVIAAVLARMSPTDAAQVLQGLCEDLRSNVLQRIGTISHVQEEVHELLSCSIEGGMETNRQLQQRREAGQATVDAILAAQEPSVSVDATVEPPSRNNRGGLPNALETNVVEQPSARGAGPNRAHDSLKLTFDDLNQMDDASLLTVLKHSQPQVIQVAILGASDTMAERLEGLSPHVVTGSVTKTPLLLGDIEHAQNELAVLALDLIQSGVIVLTTPHRLSAAA